MEATHETRHKRWPEAEPPQEMLLIKASKIIHSQGHMFPRWKLLPHVKRAKIEHFTNQLHACHLLNDMQFCSGRFCRCTSDSPLRSMWLTSDPLFLENCILYLSLNYLSDLSTSKGGVSDNLPRGDLVGLYYMLQQRSRWAKSKTKPEATAIESPPIPSLKARLTQLRCATVIMSSRSE